MTYRCPCPPDESGDIVHDRSWHDSHWPEDGSPKMICFPDTATRLENPVSRAPSAPETHEEPPWSPF